jgi:adenylate cyclase
VAEQRVQRRLAAILAADVVGFSRLMETDEADTLARLQALRRDIVDPKIAAFSGRTVKLMGDGALVEFASAVDAVTCAIEIQKSVRDHDEGTPEDRRIRLRIGINVGDIMVDGDDIYGDGVNVASRIEALAEPGGIYISRAAFDQVRDKVPIAIETRGEQTVKNIARPIEVFCVLMEKGTVASLVAGTPAAAPQRPLLPASPSIAVLAFNNMSGDAEQAYFSDGISEDIITDLSKVSELHVIARNSSFVYKDKSAVSIPDVARELGVRYVLEGSVRKAGNRVRVTAQLIDSTTGGHVWADRFDRDLTDIFAVQDELTREIVAALKVSLTVDDQERLAHSRKINVDAYNLFLRAREKTLWGSKIGNIEARKLLDAAIAIEPDYSAAHAHIAFSHIVDYANGWTDNPELTLRIGSDLAARAVEMDDEEPEAHFALAMACTWNRDFDRAIAESERCLVLSPSMPNGYVVGARARIFAGDPLSAIDMFDAYMQVDPHYPHFVLHFLAEAHISLRQFDQAVGFLQQRLERDPDSKSAYILLASCYGHLGRMEEARAAWARVQSMDPGFDIESRRAYTPFKNSADFDIRVEGIRKAGLID